MEGCLMKRLIEKQLLDWKNSFNRKPLLVYGARQVGKTYSIVDFGKTNYSNIVYFNFEGNSSLSDIFSKDLEPERIIPALEVLSGQKILEDNTLIIFDEIQECERALTSLKYFYEKAPKYHIISAGSLLGVAINRGKFSFPVGKVNTITMYPLNFEEFLMAFERYDLIEIVRKSFENNSPVDAPVHQLLLDYYHKYLAIGGMPEVVSTYLRTKDYDYVRIAQNEIKGNYYGDMTKYTDIKESNKIIATYRSIPSQLAKDNHKFQYSIIGSGARARDYETSLEWLKTAGVIYNCNKVKEGFYPIKTYEDFTSYKIYMSDVGLLACSLDITIPSIISNNVSGNTKGAIAENYVMQQLVSIGLDPYYWESNGKAEVDFVIQLNSSAIPVECKSADNVQAKSLKLYMQKYNPEYAIRISSKNFGFENNIKSIPLYAIFCLNK